jgi:signal peptidase II
MCKYARWIILFALPLFADRITKYLVLSGAWQSQIIAPFFNLYVTYNHGIAWSMGSDLHDNAAILLKIFIAVVLIYFAWYMRTIMHNGVLAMACMLILSGGISNFLDRIMYGSVVDFIQLHLGDWFFPVFNVADVAISVGALLLLYGLLVVEHDEL